MKELAEVIAVAKFHLINNNEFVYSRSKGSIRLYWYICELKRTESSLHLCYGENDSRGKYQERQLEEKFARI